MLTGIPQSAAILSTGLAYYAVDLRLMRHYDGHSSQSPVARSWRTTIPMVAVWALLMVLYVSLGFSSAVREEDASLLEKLPEYSKYMEHIGRVFPKWWR